MTNEEEKITIRDKLKAIADGQDAVYKAGLRGSTLNPVADEIIKLQRKYINESTNLLDLSLGLQETDEDGTGLRVTKDFIEIIPSSKEYLMIEHPTNATLRDFAPSLVLGKKYELVWQVKDLVSYAYLRLFGYEPEDKSKTSLVFVATEENLSSPVIAVSADPYDYGDFIEIMSAPATFYDIALYEIPEDVVADGLDERMDIIKEEVPSVYQAALNKGIEQGKQAEYDAFWDAFQENGNRRFYYYAFAWQQRDIGDVGWAADDSYNPKYPIIADTNKYGEYSTQSIFHYSSAMTDIKVPITLRNGKANSCFYRCYNLKNIPSLTLENVTSFSNTFYQCYALENCIVHGSIDVDGFDVQWSTKLSRASIESIVAALSATTTGLTVTFSLAAVNKAFEVYEGANDGSYNSIEWPDLVATRSNWNIALL